MGRGGGATLPRVLVSSKGALLLAVLLGTVRSGVTAIVSSSDTTSEGT